MDTFALHATYMKKRKRWASLSRITIVVLFPLALFYLFVVPAWVAGGKSKLGIASTIFGIFLYIQLWMVVAMYASIAASNLYGAKKGKVLQFVEVAAVVLFNQENKPFADAKSKSALRIATILICLLSYALTIYGFALAYLFISNRVPAAFSETKLHLFDAFYFSFGVATTSGSGSVTPTAVLTKVVTMFEVMVGLFYNLFFFSLFAGFLQKQQLQASSSDTDS